MKNEQHVVKPETGQVWANSTNMVREVIEVFPDGGVKTKSLFAIETWTADEFAVFIRDGTWKRRTE